MSTLTGTAGMLGLTLRRERIHAPAWYGLSALLVVVVGAGILGTYPTNAARADLAATVNADAAELFLIGPMSSTDIGGLLLWRTQGIAILFLALASLIVVGRNTRADEENGIAEMLGAAALGRAAPLSAALSVAAAGSVSAGLVVAIGFTALGADPVGSAFAGAQVIVLGVLFAGIAGLAGQLLRTSRATTSVSVTVLAVLYLVRGAVDATGGSHWTSPLGWVAALRPYADNNLLALLPALALAGACVALGLRTASRRDFGAGLLPDRGGRSRATRALRGPLSLALRTSRGTILGGSAAAAVLGLLIGSVASTVDEQVSLDLGSTGPGLAPVTLHLAPQIITVLALVTLLRARGEVTSGRAEVLLAGPLHRARWLLAHAATAGIAALAALTGLGLGLGIAHAGTGGDATDIVLWTWAAVIRAPAVWLLTALSAVVLARAPRFAAATEFTVLGLLLALEFGTELRILPPEAPGLSPFALVPQLPEGAANEPLPT
ncbi:hypothetical protein [Saccharomonospora iraqiensis]|uniref:hypothetical protein n=1 Tax=Saccharomonospora iraqiensis TaxID=52698 RepID=UPI00022DECD0|nr:hypothetical protein [Saccharomonospora iraqiensis]